MQDRQVVFDKYMESFIKLDYEDKCKEVIEKQKRILALLVKCAQNKGVYPILLKSSEINDINKENPTNDDYIEAIMVYTQDIEELYGQILIND